MDTLHYRDNGCVRVSKRRWSFSVGVLTVLLAVVLPRGPAKKRQEKVSCFLVFHTSVLTPDQTVNIVLKYESLSYPPPPPVGAHFQNFWAEEWWIKEIPYRFSIMSILKDTNYPSAAEWCFPPTSLILYRFDFCLQLFRRTHSFPPSHILNRNRRHIRPTFTDLFKSNKVLSFKFNVLRKSATNLPSNYHWQMLQVAKMCQAIVSQLICIVYHTFICWEFVIQANKQTTKKSGNPVPRNPPDMCSTCATTSQ